MFAQVSGLEPGELVHVIADCHIYDRHLEMVENMTRLEPFDAPKFRIDPTVRDFYAFTPKSFKMENYRYHPFEGTIPVAI
jgi:thymidylate synthase